VSSVSPRVYFNRPSGPRRSFCQSFIRRHAVVVVRSVPVALCSRIDVRVSLYLVGNGRQGGRSLRRLLYPAVLVVMGETEDVSTTCIESAGLVTCCLTGTACGDGSVDGLFSVCILSAVRDFDEMARSGPS
jgi:hypothetical protein